MQIEKFCHISGTISLLLGILIATPAFGQRSDNPKCDALTEFEKKICDPKCDALTEFEKKICAATPDPSKCKSTADLERDLWLYGKLTEDDWKTWEGIEICAERRKAKLADGKYKHYQGGWRRYPAFFFRSMNLSGKFEETNGVNTGLDSDGLPGHFDTSKSLRQVSFGWSKKKILEDVIVAVYGLESLANAKKTLSLHNFSLLEGLTVDATVSHGRTVDFKEDINGLNDLNNLAAKTNWTVKVQYQIPIDKLFGLDYKTK